MTTAASTPIVLGDGIAPVTVPLPPGYSRVWSGRIYPGDLYLNRLDALTGSLTWVRISFVDIVEWGNYYDSPMWFVCVVREGDREIGHPCPVCRVGVVMEPFRCCWRCTRL